MKLRIGILGTRGIPNNYGGFEQISGYLAKGLVERGHAVTVYNSHKHPYQQPEWNGVTIIHCYNPEHLIGTAGQFIYDLNCIIDARTRAFDIILLMGYTSSSIWGWLTPSNCLVLSNMDGLEWMRSKYSKPIQRFLKFAEKLAVKYSNGYIADSLVIKEYLADKYAIDAVYIPYGAEVLIDVDNSIGEKYNLRQHEYFMLVARMEPENNIELILSGFQTSNSVKQFVVVGDTGNQYGQYITNKFREDKRILFIGPVFDIQKLHTLRAFSSLYFHGHSVGGTNPSLLEAMASKTFIAAHNNPFNKRILEEDALYFSSSEEVKDIIEQNIQSEKRKQAIIGNFDKIQNRYNWEHIVDRYEHFILASYNAPAVEKNISHKEYARK